MLQPTKDSLISWPNTNSCIYNVCTLCSMQHFLIARGAASTFPRPKTICYRPVKRMRCLINISSAAFLSEMCPLTLLLTLTNVSSEMQFSPSVSPQLGGIRWGWRGVGEASVSLIFNRFHYNGQQRSSEQTRCVLGSAMSGGKRRQRPCVAHAV